MEIKTLRNRYVVGAVLCERPACAHALNRNDVETGLRIGRVDIVRSQQAMALRADIIDLPPQALRQFPLDTEIVLSCVLSTHVRLEIAVQKDRTEAGPVLRLSWSRIQNPLEGIRIYRPVLLNKRGIEERSGQVRTSAKRWFRAELLQDQLLHGIVEKSPAGTDAGLAISTEQLTQESARNVGAVSKPHTGSESLVVGLRETRGNAIVTREDQAGRLHTRSSTG